MALFRLSIINIFLYLFSLALIAKGSFVWPSMGKITSPYGNRYGMFHTGIDIDDSVGRDIRAAESGIVKFSGDKGRYGLTIIIDHSSNIQTLYAHNAKLYVDVGETVYQGQKIAKMGSSGRSTNRHLHFEVRVGGKTQNPILYLEKR